MKSETYQKEGWFILEEEIRVFGSDAESFDGSDLSDFSNNLFNFNHTDKKKEDMDASVKEFEDFIESVSKDAPELSEEEIDEGIEKILKKAYPSEIISASENEGKSKKVTLKVLFLVAILAVIAVTGVFVTGTEHNFNIQNAFVVFNEDCLKVVFFGDKKEKTISPKTLIQSLEEHDFKGVLLPEETLNGSGNYKASIPEYKIDEFFNQVEFEIADEDSRYRFCVSEYDIEDSGNGGYTYMTNAETVIADGVYVYIFQFDDSIKIEYVQNGFHYSMATSTESYQDMIELAKTLKKGDLYQ